MAHPLAKFDFALRGEAIAEAEEALRATGFSIGRAMMNRPRGIMFGAVDVKPWGAMSRSETLDLHGQMWGGTYGEVSIMLHADAPAEAVRAFYSLLAAIDAKAEAA